MGSLKIRVFAMRVLILVVLAFLASVSPVPAQRPSKAPLQVTEWTVPWEKTRPRDPYLDAQGRVWFVGQTGNYIAYLNPTSGEFKRYEIDDGTHPHNLIVDKSGRVWFAGNQNARIGALDAASGKSTIYPMPDGSPRDPHTLVFDKKGDIWFTAQRGNAVGHIDTKTGKVRIAKVATENALPYGIVVDRQDRPWFVEFGSNKLATIDPATLAVQEYPLPNANSRARRLEVTSDGAIWYGDYSRGMLARFDPKSRKVDEWPMPGGARSLPYAMAVDERDRLWLVETGIQPNRLVGFDTKTKTWISDTPIEKSGARTVRHMIYHAPTRTLWFGTDANTIGRATVP
jgi:virginiamycin B lyase